MKKTYKSPELTDRGSAVELTMEGGAGEPEPQIGLPEKVEAL